MKRYIGMKLNEVESELNVKGEYSYETERVEFGYGDYWFEFEMNEEEEWICVSVEVL